MLLHPLKTSAGGLRAELRVAAPAAAAFGYISDLRTMVSWWPEHPLYLRLRGDGGAGSLYAWIYRLRGVPLAGLSRVLACEAGERFEYRAGPPGVGPRIEYRFTPEGDATRLRFSFLTPLARVPGFAAHLVPELTRAFDRLDDSLAKAG